jgi:Spy/CpxP family protein refolding chaperone
MEMREPGQWWKNAALMQRIGVSDEQVQKIDKIYQDHRPQLVDLRAEVDKQEAMLEPLVEADQPNEAQVVAQIDKVAQARANLEKANAKMLLAMRRVLTVDQWKQVRNLPGASPFRARPRPRPLAFPAMPPPVQ